MDDKINEKIEAGKHLFELKWTYLEQAVKKNFVLQRAKDKIWVANKIVEGVKTFRPPPPDAPLSTLFNY